MSDIYNEYYYKNYNPMPYDSQEYWEHTFGLIADQIVNDLNPRTVLDAGCAMGYLVAALRDRGVEAYGIDISEYAVSKVREDIKQYCVVGSLTESLPSNLPSRFDLVVTIEVLEHLLESDGKLAIRNLCTCSDQIIFVSTPNDYAEKTHFNVQKSNYWVKLFAENGFYNNVNYIPKYIAPYAIFFYRCHDFPGLVSDYEQMLQTWNNKYHDLLEDCIGKISCLGKIYLDTGHGYNEQEQINLNGSLKGYFHYHVDLPSGVHSVRFDPVDGVACIVDNLMFKTNNGEINYTCNGISVGRFTLFTTNDPQYEIRFGQSSVSNLEIQGNISFITDMATQAIIQINQEFENTSNNLVVLSEELKETSKKLVVAAHKLDEKSKMLELVNKETITFKEKLDEQSKMLRIAKEELIVADQKIIELKEEVEQSKNQFNAILDSTSWKITKPVRLVSGLIKKITGELRRISKHFHYYLKYYIDCSDFSNNILTLSGWIFLLGSEIKRLQVVITTNKKHYSIDITERIRRPDVFAQFKNENARSSGFKTLIRIENCTSFDVSLRYYSKSRKHNIKIESFKSDDSSDVGKPVISLIESDSATIDLEDWVNKNTFDKPSYPAQLYAQPIDIIVPIFNGYEYLDSLFNSIVLTKMKYRMIIVDDKSTDSRVWPYLNKRFAGDKKAVLLNNETNQGFVRSVNTAFGISKNHVVIVNTDTELPEMWLERIMAPVILDKKVASATPYTNAGTICSFPDIGLNNKMFENLPLNVIDKAFQQIRPSYCPMPTGVGFCMAINKEALNLVGIFDADTFSKGYGEENDWCQRAIQHGYKNVTVENLFVYHKHGGSFASEEKQKLLDKNQKLLLKKHPNYLKDVARFFEVDPLRLVRNYIIMRLSFDLEKKPILVFDHNIGGGATNYIDKRVIKWVNSGYPVIIVRYDSEHDIFLLNYKYMQYKFSYSFKSFNFLKTVFIGTTLDTIYINELVTYPDLYQILKEIVEIKETSQAKLLFLFHDYYALCPSCNLLNNKREFCGIHSFQDCAYCLKSNKMISYINYNSREKWVENWRQFLLKCTDIVAFSNSSAELVARVYGNSLKISIQPHKVINLPQINKLYKTTKKLNIGILGTLSYHKGAKIIKQILDIINQNNYRVKIILIGSYDKKINDPNFIETGKYTIDMVPKLVYQYDVDLFFISSIWPETFSYTTEEAIKFNMPVVAFNIGAPAERISNYPKGKLIETIDAKAAIDTILQFSNNVTAKISPYINKKILFVTEYITFSSRYRVEHLREQLLMKGITSDFIEVKEVDKYDIYDYCTLFIYRCSYTEKLKNKIVDAQAKGKKVIYEIDDYIFDYNAIKDFDFLKKDEYKDFEFYSNGINECMKLCDCFMTSTVNLKEMIEKSFPNRPVCINRNIASMEMVIISQNAIDNVSRASNKVVLGYFSGSKTHDKDFLKIKDVLLKLLNEHDNLYLKLGGVVETDNEFSRYEDRIERSGFVEWQLLPEIIASVDVNLMPLEDTIFHACKSENKWMEAALVKVPTVASNNNELERVIQNGETGYLCSTPEEWISVLDKLINDKCLREKIAEAAYNKVTKDYTTGNISPEVIDFVIGS